MAKAIGIIAVVFGHAFADTFSANIIYMFHMPLFFFLGGYLYRSQDPGEYFKKKGKYLLVPYVIYAVLLTVDVLIKLDFFGANFSPAALASMKDMAVKNAFYGGEKLTGTLGVFWFVTSFFFAQQLYNIICRYAISFRRAIILFFYGLSLFLQLCYPKFSLPLALNTVTYTIVFFYLGDLFKQHRRRQVLVVLFGIVAVVVSLFAAILYPQIRVSIKHMNYGIPLLSVLGAVGFSVLILSFSEILVRSKTLSQLGNLLGGASFTIMFMHLYVFYMVVSFMGPWWGSLVAIVVSVLCHLLFQQSAALRLLFLG